MLSKKRPTLPGEFIKEDILSEFDLTQEQLAEKIGVSRKTINELVNGKRRVTADMALRLGKLTQTNAQVWLNIQNSVDLWDAVHSRENAKFLRQIEPCMT